MSSSRPHSYRSTPSHDTAITSSPRSPSITSPTPTRNPFHGSRGPSPPGLAPVVRLAQGDRSSPLLARRGSPPPRPCKRPVKIRPLASSVGLLTNGTGLQAKTRHLIPRIGLTGTTAARWAPSASSPHLDHSRSANEPFSASTVPAAAASHTLQTDKNKFPCTVVVSSLSRAASSGPPRTVPSSFSSAQTVCSSSLSTRTSLARTTPLQSHSSSTPTVSNGPAQSLAADGALDPSSSKEGHSPLVSIISSSPEFPTVRSVAPPHTASSSQTVPKTAACDLVAAQTAAPNPVQSVNKFMRRLSRGKRKNTVVNKYCEEMNQLNEVANNRPRGALIHSIQQENRYIRELQEENKELRLALEEQQNVMELIMSKYREQVAKLLSSGPDPHSADNTAMQRKLGANIERVSEMVCVMRRAAQLDEDQSQHFQQLVTALVRENKGLREMLLIAIQSGSVSSPERLDADTQTDPSTASDTDTIKLNPNFIASAAADRATSGATQSSASPTLQALPAAAASEELAVTSESGGTNDQSNDSEQQSSSDRISLNNNQNDEDDEGRGGPAEETTTS